MPTGQYQGTNGTAMERVRGDTSSLGVRGNAFGRTWRGVLMRVATLDQLEFVYYSLANTQVTNDNGVIVTDPERWQRFSERYRENIEYVMMLATVILVLNIGLMAVYSVHQPRVILPWVYTMSVFCVTASIMTGTFMHSPRQLRDNRQSTFDVVVYAMSIPFIFFMYSTVFLVASLFCAFSLPETRGWMIAVGIGLLGSIISVYRMVMKHP